MKFSTTQTIYDSRKQRADNVYQASQHLILLHIYPIQKESSLV